MVRSAVVDQLTVIGEAVARLSQELRDRRPNIPWGGHQKIPEHRRAQLFRDRLAGGVARGNDGRATLARTGR